MSCKRDLRFTFFFYLLLLPFTSILKPFAEVFDRWGTGSVTLGHFLPLCLCIVPNLPL